jgi:hypothetical protein
MSWGPRARGSGAEEQGAPDLRRKSGAESGRKLATHAVLRSQGASPCEPKKWPAAQEVKAQGIANSQCGAASQRGGGPRHPGFHLDLAGLFFGG